MQKRIHRVSVAGVRTLNLLIIYLLPQPLNDSSRILCFIASVLLAFRSSDQLMKDNEEIEIGVFESNQLGGVRWPDPLEHNQSRALEDLHISKKKP